MSCNLTCRVACFLLLRKLVSVRSAPAVTRRKGVGQK